MSKPKWIFFDVGSTLMDETEAYNHRIRDIIANTDISFEAFDAMLKERGVQVPIRHMDNSAGLMNFDKHYELKVAGEKGVSAETPNLYELIGRQYWGIYVIL